MYAPARDECVLTDTESRSGTSAKVSGSAFAQSIHRFDRRTSPLEFAARIRGLPDTDVSPAHPPLKDGSASHTAP